LLQVLVGGVLPESGEQLHGRERIAHLSRDFPAVVDVAQVRHRLELRS
jgi:hypothetical protein